MARIDELNFTFTDGETILNADIMNVIQDKINTLVRIHNEETPQIVVLATKDDKDSSSTGLITTTGGRQTKSSYTMYNFFNADLASRWKTISVKAYGLSSDGATTAIAFYSRYSGLTDFDLVSVVAIPNNGLYELTDIDIPEGTVYVRVQNKPAGLADADMVIEIKGY